jgi:hypothetical protein
MMLEAEGFGHRAQGSGHPLYIVEHRVARVSSALAEIRVLEQSDA